MRVGADRHEGDAFPPDYACKTADQRRMSPGILEGKVGEDEAGRCRLHIGCHGALQL